MTDRSHHAGAGAGRGRTGPPGYPPAAPSCSQDQRFAMGSYALGALDPAEADHARLHLVECAACRAEYREMAGVPAILARITETEMSAVPVVPTDDMLARLLQEARFRDPSAFESAVGAGMGFDAMSDPSFAPGVLEADPGAETLSTGPAPHARGRRRAVVRQKSRFLSTLWSGSAFRRVSLAAAGGALAAVAVIGVYAATSTTQPSVFSNSLEATNSAMNITGSLQYHATAWGSWVQVTMHNVPPGDDCMLLAVDSKGNRVVASTWWAPSSGSATIPGGVAMQASEITKFEVVTATGQTLLNLPVKGATTATPTGTAKY